MESAAGRARAASKRSRKSIQNQVSIFDLILNGSKQLKFACRTKCDVTEEEEIDVEFRELFPSFHDVDFKDFEQKELTDDEMETSQSQQTTTVISSEDIEFIIDLHIRFMAHCTKTEWLLGERERTLRADFVSPLIEKVKLSKRILDNYTAALNYEFDLKILNALNVLIFVAQRYGDVNFTSKLSKCVRVELCKFLPF